MADEHGATDFDRQYVYQIKLTGHLDQTWTDWFEGMTITLQDDGHTLLTGPLADQAALHGLLKKVRDVGLPLVAVNRLDPATSDEADTNEQDETSP